MLTELGDIELQVPRTRHYSALKVVRAYARRTPHIDRMILACFVLGISTRKVAEALLPVLGERVSASTVSRVGKQLDEVVEAFHRRSLSDCYRVLVFDGVVMARKTGLERRGIYDVHKYTNGTIKAWSVVQDNGYTAAASDHCAVWADFRLQLNCIQQREVNFVSRRGINPSWWNRGRLKGIFDIEPN